MPIYEFDCTTCDKAWDEMMSMNEYGDLVTFTCPHCGKKQGKEARTNIGKGLHTTVNGVSKGNYGSGGY
jgi:putative FmdB family regulatory protein